MELAVIKETLVRKGGAIRWIPHPVMPCDELTGSRRVMPSLCLQTSWPSLSTACRTLCCEVPKGGQPN